MDLVAFGFLLLIVLLGGVSAYAADSIAWKIGKRRHSMFGLRPKNFARLVVTVMGMLIPLVTLIFVSTASRDVREWITRGRAAINELPEAVRRLEESNAAVAEAQRQGSELQARNNGLRSSNKTLNDQIRSQSALLQSSKAQLQSQKQTLTGLTQKIRGLVDRQRVLAEKARLSADRAKSLQEKNRSVQENLKNVESSLTLATRSLEREQTRLRNVQGQAREAEAFRDRANAEKNEINDQNLKLSGINFTLTQNIEALQKQTANLQKEIDSLEMSRTAAQQDSEYARNEYDRLRSSISELEATLSAVVEGSRTAPLSFSRGDELARLSVPAGASVADSQAIVVTLLRNSVREAERLGAKRGTTLGGASVDAADIVTSTFENGVSLNREQQIERLATLVAGKPEAQLIIARSLFNFFGNEPVLLQLEAVPNPVIYADGQLVAEARVDGRRSEEAIYTQIAEFLGSRVNAAAREAKMVPKKNRGEETFGQVDTVEVFNLMRQLKDAGRVIRLQAYAKGEIRAGDPLAIDLRLR